MLTNDKQVPALRAIHAVLIWGRFRAYEGKSTEIAALLDVGEYLVTLMLEAADRTDAFREQLVGLSQLDPRYASALRVYDAAP